jgi:hypothetical protein
MRGSRLSTSGSETLQEKWFAVLPFFNNPPQRAQRYAEYDGKRSVYFMHFVA